MLTLERFTGLSLTEAEREGMDREGESGQAELPGLGRSGCWGEGLASPGGGILLAIPTGGKEMRSEGGTPKYVGFVAGS